MAASAAFEFVKRHLNSRAPLRFASGASLVQYNIRTGSSPCTGKAKCRVLVSKSASVVLRVTHLLEPDGVGGVAVRQRALRELAIGRRAVPMLDVRCRVESLAGCELA
jgi:hypothetical protein